MAHNGTVLVVEDDTNLANLISMHVGDAGFQVDRAATGDEGLRKALSGSYDLLVLDLMLPGVDGLSICRQVRSEGSRGDRSYTPILMVTARSQEMDKVLGLELGADDYITKPFSTRELVARVKALVRRAREMDPAAHDGAGESVIRIGELEVDTGRRRVFLAGAEVELTSKEYELLTLLASHPGQAFNREQLLDRVWNYQHVGYSHTVNSHINRLRAKIESDPSNPRYVLTVWGYGYRFVEPAEAAEERE